MDGPESLPKLKQSKCAILRAVFQKQQAKGMYVEAGVQRQMELYKTKQNGTLHSTCGLQQSPWRQNAIM